MPIFHDPHDSPPWRTASLQTSTDELPKEPTNSSEDASSLGSLSLESILGSSATHEPVSQEARPTSRDRNGLIERIKRVKSPLWQFRQDISNHTDRSLQCSRPPSRDRPKTPTSPSKDLHESRTSAPDQIFDQASAGLEIARPRSALHSGDFREREGGAEANDSSSSTFLATSPSVPWNRSFPAAAVSPSRNAALYAFNDALNYDVSRARAISQSPSASFTFLPPTSPLVQQINNTDLDTSSRPSSRRGSRSPERSSRRHTFSPDCFEQYQTTQTARSAAGTPAARRLRRGRTVAYQAHQPRRSVTSLSQFEPHSSPQTPFAARRPSISDVSPLQHAPMVGSYEESILRGRMSTTPSRPLDFVAKIGVLGRGQCKSSLKCPPHVTVPFPAVFYSYNTGNGKISDNEPSPYVGLIDLEHSLAPPVEVHDNSKRKRRAAAQTADQESLDFRLRLDDEHAGENGTAELRRKEKRKRRSTSPKAPPGGCYRIPAEGQLQIVLKNPNRTAVKLFLVPYDISDMEPGQKTFIRQRSYSAGPIIDMPLSSRKNLGTDRPEAALSNSDDPRDRPILRYLVHLHICCTGKGRYYLYKSVRVVFANRVPDGKEKLRNEIQQPEPKYSTYKSSRESTIALPPNALTIAERACRRQSAAWPLSSSQQIYDQMDGLAQNPELPPPAVRFTGGSRITSTPGDYGSSIPLIQPIPFNLTRLASIESRPVSREQMDIDTKKPFRSPIASPPPGFGHTTIHQEATFQKLNRGDVGYGGNAFSPLGSPASPPAAGLLAQRLRSLEVQPDDDAS
ncbi:uncharacterized protein M421DRAFT_6507 [Didymella exigua CBS 183.55]|uniref:Atos-like conserved domain-containing protein n=1 Tax=Didymella exigua CBS 183.55 TaxID=1150837 RepID=A0A6A5RGR7_9PLEO|nr:uncharacterized protein M421DRAFT_6507 [Didymella exigua CBS 183.55]KAF1926942.1 hypothetical protein M421DRAFT_6507 [Didymella exigua CBS 183.55]